VFREKIKTCPLSSIRPDFVGPNTYYASITFIKQEFHKRHDLYPNFVGTFLTTTTDSMSVKVALEYSLTTTKFIEMDLSFTEMWTFLTGTHTRLGSESPIFQSLSQNPLYDKRVLHLISVYLSVVP